MPQLLSALCAALGVRCMIHCWRLAKAKWNKQQAKLKKRGNEWAGVRAADMTAGVRQAVRQRYVQADNFPGDQHGLS